MRSLNEKILGKKEGGGLSKIDHQELAWLRHERDPLLFKKAEKIIEALKGKGFWIKEFSREHNIYTSYLYIAIKKLNYHEIRRRGTPSVGLDFFYEKK